MVPPLAVTCFCSAISDTTGCGVASSSSMELAFSRPQTLRENSMAAICKPRQMPKKGTLRSRAYFTAAILPSVPRMPNPPGTRMASACWSSVSAPSCSIWVESMKSSETRESLAIPPWTSASFSDL